jgi:hypothetical protein
VSVYKAAVQRHQQLEIAIRGEGRFDAFLVRNSLEALLDLKLVTFSTVVTGSGMMFGITKKRL